MLCSDNVQTFAANMDNYYDSKIPEILNDVLLFTASSKENRNELFINSVNKNDDGKYFFDLNGEKYYFSLFSDCELQEFDKKY